MTLKCYGCGAAFPNFGARANHGRYSKTCTEEARFWGKVDKRGPDECWNWRGAKRWDGYGRLTWQSKQTTANRVAYELTHGEIAPKLTILHSCDNPSCCNPRHLSAGSHTDNMQDMHRKGRASAKLTAAQVREIRRELSVYPMAKRLPKGVSKKLAERYGVGDKTISVIRHGHKWKHV